jgi:hypothetical protein
LFPVLVEIGGEIRLRQPQAPQEVDSLASPGHPSTEIGTVANSGYDGN